jgi:hypothetical protein
MNHKDITYTYTYTTYLKKVINFTAAFKTATHPIITILKYEKSPIHQLLTPFPAYHNGHGAKPGDEPHHGHG